MKEVRNVSYDEAEIRASQGRTIEGYGIVFNSMSRDLGGFTEIILPEAIQGVLEKSDIVSVLNHNKDRGVLARSKEMQGSLKLAVDSKGVKYSFDAPKFDLGDEVLEGVKRGDIKGSSFAFTVDSDRWERNGDNYIRTILQFGRIFDISPVYNEAYADTTIAVRGLDEFRSTEVVDEVKVDEEPIVEETTECTTDTETEDITEYYAELTKQLDDIENKNE